MSTPIPSKELCLYLDVNFQEVHGILLTCAWFIFTNCGIWALNFKSHPYGMFIHIGCMSCAAFLMALGPIMMIVTYGSSIILQFWFHQTWGFVFYCTLPVILLSGSICKISKTKADMAPEKVYFNSKAHSIFGWVYIFGVTVPMCTGWYGGGVLTNVIFGFVLLVDAISFSIYLYLKFFKQRM